MPREVLEEASKGIDAIESIIKWRYDDWHTEAAKESASTLPDVQTLLKDRFMVAKGIRRRA